MLQKLSKFYQEELRNEEDKEDSKANDDKKDNQLINNDHIKKILVNKLSSITIHP